VLLSRHSRSKRKHEEHGRYWYVKMDVKLLYESVDWILLSVGRVHRRVVINTEINLQVL
jgi:hypothetical protein